MRLLPALHEGHAPIYLHHAFADALEAFDAWRQGEEEPFIDYEGALVRISAVFGRMRSCTDVIPGRILDEVAALAGGEAFEDGEGPPTYGQAARVMRALCIGRLRAAR